MGLDVDKCIESLRRREILPEQSVRELCETLKGLLIYESNVQRLQSPITVVGDVHGQFYDFLEIFRIAGSSPDTNFLFLGDYVDRGYFSVETVSLLICLKTYGFYSECMRKYGNANVWQYFTDMFDYLTIAAVIDNRIFCIHGGLSPSIHTLDQIRVLDRFKEIPHEGPLADLVWSDPDPEREGFNLSQRGAGYTFGGDVVAKFLKVNQVEHILRAHQLCLDGYQVLYRAALCTVWSAPNYCYRCGNIASVLEIDSKLNKYFNTFTAAPESERQVPVMEGTKDVPDYFL